MRHIIAVAWEPREMRPEPGIDAAVGAGIAQRVGVCCVGIEADRRAGADRRFRRQRAGFLESGGQFARLDLARFDVGLIERIDPEHRSGDRGGDFEAKKFLADILDRLLHDANDRVAGFFQRRKLCFVVGVVFAVEPEVDENAVVP
jgi:hypothetical protein